MAPVVPDKELHGIGNRSVSAVVPVQLDQRSAAIVQDVPVRRDVYVPNSC